ncbi:hypothetical protein ACJRO7_022302 [Eucalyptus globulus]|uniref:Reverse transcriptase zinc-binding domain-containing protein n=1 Tax=Eucalyptus globulus TaxID=34317 RepID=A0ABD3KP79_EUCGL
MSISVWYDHWHQQGPLCFLIPDSIIVSSSLSRLATVVDLCSSSDQSLISLLECWGISLPMLSLRPDRFSWRCSSSGVFSIALAWDTIRTKRYRVPWASFIWNKALAPRYQFNLWLIIKNRLPTQVLLLSYGRIDHALCAFCNSTPNSINHLFFDCHVSATLAYFWATRCNLPWRNRPWVDNLRWALDFLSGKDFYHSIARFSFGALCHLIWKKRNNIIFRGEALVVPALKKHLIKVIKDKVLTFSSVPDIPRNKRLQRSWGFDPSIFFGPSPHA